MLREIQEFGSHAMDIYSYLLAGIGRQLTHKYIRSLKDFCLLMYLFVFIL